MAAGLANDCAHPGTDLDNLPVATAEYALALRETSARQLGLLRCGFWRNLLVVATGWMVGVRRGGGDWFYRSPVIPHILRLCGLTNRRVYFRLRAGRNIA